MNKKSRTGTFFLILLCIITCVFLGTQIYASKQNNQMSESLYEAADRVADSDCGDGDLAIFYTADAKNADQAEDIDSLTVAEFNEKKHRINVVSIDKRFYEECGSIKDVIRKVNTLKKMNVENYIFVDTLTIKTLVDNDLLISATVAQDEVDLINSNIRSLADRWGIQDYILVDVPGDRIMDGLQAAAFADIHNEGMLQQNTGHFRRIVCNIITNLGGCSFDTLEDYFPLLSECSSDIDSDRYYELMVMMNHDRFHELGYYDIFKEKIVYGN